MEMVCFITSIVDGPKDQGPVSRPLSTSSARSTSGIIKAIRSRIQAIRSGELLSIMFIR